MNTHREDRLKKLLQQALPPVANDSEPARDLWPGVLHRLDAPTPAPFRFGVWFDGALAVGLVVFFAIFPASIPMLLYYL